VRHRVRDSDEDDAAGAEVGTGRDGVGVAAVLRAELMVEVVEEYFQSLMVWSAEVVAMV
jgi:hypothetical protein